MAERIRTLGGDVDAGDLGVTLMHEHVFVRDLQLERDLPGLEWDEPAAVERAVRSLAALDALGVGTVVDLTVVGLGRDVELVRRVAERVPIELIASTGCYVAGALPLYFGFHGPGRLIDGPDPLEELFVRDIEEGIAGSGVRAGVIKVTTAGPEPTEDEARVLAAAAAAHQRSGILISTHSDPRTHNGLSQQAFLEERGVSPARMVIGHSGDTDDLAYLRAIMDRGSTIGMDRFGMKHVFDDERRIATVVPLAQLGYADGMVLSHDAAFYSHVTPPSWRATHAPDWHMEHIPRRILPELRRRGVPRSQLDLMLIDNPRRLLTPTRT